jgi:ankyrin repeat protein
MERIEGQVTDSQELAKQVLAWITCAKRLLTTTELRHALAVEIGDSEFDEENVPEIEDIISVCAGLVTVDEKSHTVRLVHYTTQEFFERTQISWFPDAQRNIATTCVIYLSFNAFKTGFCPTDEEFETRLQLNPFYDYAARNWGHHMRAASTEVEQLTLDLLDSETRVSGASQAMMALGGYPDYSQKVPRQITGVHLAAHFGLTKAIIALLKNGYDPDSIDTYDQTPLSWAAQNGQETVIKLLLLETDGVDPDSEDVCGRTPLSWAARYGHEAVVKFLLATGGVDPDSRSDDYQTPLSLAAAHGHDAVMELLLTNNRVDINTKDTNGQTLLSRAAGNGHEAMVKLLLAKDGVDIDSKDRYGQTPLLLAAGNGHVAVVKLLLAKDVVDPDFKDNFDRTPLSWAARRGNSTVVKLLLEKYEEKGIIIRDKDVNITTSSTADDHPSIITCDICMFRIPDVDIHYHCGICCDGDFDICQECIASGIFCFNKFHKLVKRRVKDGTLVEVLD